MFWKFLNCFVIYEGVFISCFLAAVYISLKLLKDYAVLGCEIYDNKFEISQIQIKI